jgi:hypothetical protein
MAGGTGQQDLDPKDGGRSVVIDPPSEEARQLWLKVLELAKLLGPNEDWALVGGLMVQLHAYEHASTSRPTDDIDILSDARKKATQRIAKILDLLGDLTMPPVNDPRLGYQWSLDGHLVELLAPDGLKADPQTIGKHETIRIDGGTQALQRSELVLVSVAEGEAVPVRRPTLLGAILIKARALNAVREKEQEHREDLARLLSFVDDPRAMAKEMKSTERHWLRRIEKRLELNDETLGGISAPDLVMARQAFALLTS